MVKFGEFIMILELHRQGLKVAAIARQLGVDRKTVRKYISHGLEPPAYGPRPRGLPNVSSFSYRRTCYRRRHGNPCSERHGGFSIAGRLNGLQA